MPLNRNVLTRILWDFSARLRSVEMTVRIVFLFAVILSDSEESDCPKRNPETV